MENSENKPEQKSEQSTSKKSDRKLKNILINSDYQLRYSFIVSLSYLGLVALLITVSYLYLSEHYVPLIEQAVSEDIKNQLLAEVQEIILYMGLTVVSSVLIIILGSIVISHRVAGPMHNLRRVCDEIRKGDFKARVHFRSKDEFKEVPDAFNSMVDKLTENQK